jgi:hypothetical protein
MSNFRQRVKPVLISLLSCCALLRASGAASFTGMLDQTYVPANWTIYDFGYDTFAIPPTGLQLGQTFQAGISGTMTGLNLLLGRYGSSLDAMTNDVVVTIRSVGAGGAPDATLLTATVAASALPFNPPVNQVTWVPVGLGSGLAVTAGESLAIVVSSAEPLTSLRAYGWPSAGTAGDYAAGDAWSHFDGGSWSALGYDRGFQTFVTPIPEPGGVRLSAVVAFIGMAARKRKRCREERSVIVAAYIGSAAAALPQREAARKLDAPRLALLQSHYG